jgi:hypothetical protein
MKRSRLILTLTGVIVIALLIAVVLAVNLPMPHETGSNLYVCPISIGEKTYIVTVATDWPYEPKVYLPEFDQLKYFSVDFIGPDRKQCYFNITYPDDLIWGDFTLIWKYYEQNSDRYTLSGNGTHHSVYMAFNHTATIEHFEIRGTEAAW